ncbi:hypothetical protein [Bartonella sp. F02]|uniref:hypothetical protein n=1 Tax=Bartonella sp. F02 TaxID=2967262 RepID=UPI0022A9F5E4|nr:hypothetical protein [Bartonella sp. F02]MCZ2328733.1 hypothetical protein [Bartonella sp. F02]
MFIQSILFFILGVAFTCWLLLLVFPIIWHRMLHFAHKFAAEKIPSSLTEIQENYDFLCAQHAVELVRNEQKYVSLQKKYARQKIQFSQIKEQLYQLLPLEQQTSYIDDEIKALPEETKQNTSATDIFIMEINAMREKIAHYRKRLQKIQISELKSSLNHQILHELQEEAKELATTLTAQIALKEGKDSPINALIKNSQSKNDLASRIRKKTTRAKKSSSK